MKVLLWGCALVTVLLCGCGYTTGSLLPSNYRTIYVDHFSNKVAYTSENNRGLYIPQLENRVRTAVMDRFQFDGHLHIKESNQSDLVLKGDLISFDREELRVSENQDVQEYRIRITLALTLTDPATSEVVWEEPSFAGEATYFRTGPQAKSESTAIDEALVDVARRVVERTIENW